MVGRHQISYEPPRQKKPVVQMVQMVRPRKQFLPVVRQAPVRRQRLQSKVVVQPMVRRRPVVADQFLVAGRFQNNGGGQGQAQGGWKRRRIGKNAPWDVPPNFLRR